MFQPRQAVADVATISYPPAPPLEPEPAAPFSDPPPE
jgi:hypothetical protein